MINNDIAPWKKKLPFHLSMSRVYALPLILFLMTREPLAEKFLAAVVFALASLTDYFDGHLARKWNVVTTLGKFLDPVTDKILVSSVLCYLLFQGKVDPYSVILLIARDTFIGGIRSVAATDKIIIDAKPAGKWKTGLQMGAIPLLILSPYHDIFDKVGYGLLWISVILSITSGIEYFQGYLKSKKSMGLSSI